MATLKRPPFPPLKTLTEIDEIFGSQTAEPPPQSRFKDVWQSPALWISFCIILVILTFIIIIFDNTRSNGLPRRILGFAGLSVLSDSMEPEIPKDSFILIKKIDPIDLKIDDDITFLRDKNTTVTHRIIGIYENYANSGARGFETKGVNNGAPDRTIVFAGDVVGKVVFHSKPLGVVLGFIKKNVIFSAIFGILLLGAIWFLKNRKIFRKHSREKGFWG